MIPLLFVFLGISGFVVASGALLWLVFSRRGLRGVGDWTKRFERLEAEVERLKDQETRQYLEDEVHRLDEKVAFLENLLADRPQTGALPSSGREGSRDPDR